MSSLPPILRDNQSILNASAAATAAASIGPPPSRSSRYRPPLFHLSLQMPTSSSARAKAPPALTPTTPTRSGTFFGDLPSPSSSSKGGAGASVSPKAGAKPSFLSDRQMTVLGLTQAANSQKRVRAKSRLTTAAKMSASNTDLSSNLSSSHPTAAKAKLTRVHSENKISDLHSRHRNFSDSNLVSGSVALSRSFNRQPSRIARPTGNLTSRSSFTASVQATPAATGDDSDSDEEREGRIVEWLLGVEDADAVTDQVVIEEPPRQTDTAIHIVYQGD